MNSSDQHFFGTPCLYVTESGSDQTFKKMNEKHFPRNVRDVEKHTYSRNVAAFGSTVSPTCIFRVSKKEGKQESMTEPLGLLMR